MCFLLVHVLPSLSPVCCDVQWPGVRYRPINGPSDQSPMTSTDINMLHNVESLEISFILRSPQKLIIKQRSSSWVYLVVTECHLHLVTTIWVFNYIQQSDKKCGYNFFVVVIWYISSDFDFINYFHFISLTIFQNTILVSTMK